MRCCTLFCLNLIICFHLSPLAATLSRQSAVRPGVCPSQRGGGRLLRTGIPGPSQDDGETHLYSGMYIVHYVSVPLVDIRGYLHLFSIVSRYSSEYVFSTVST